MNRTCEFPGYDHQTHPVEALVLAFYKGGQPIAFASRFFIDTEAWYENIEREVFAVMFVCMMYHMCFHGREFIVECNQKP